MDIEAEPPVVQDAIWNVKFCAKTAGSYGEDNSSPILDSASSFVDKVYRCDALGYESCGVMVDGNSRVDADDICAWNRAECPITMISFGTMPGRGFVEGSDQWIAATHVGYNQFNQFWFPLEERRK